MADLMDNNLLIKGSRTEMIKFYNFMGENIGEKLMELENNYIDSLENEEDKKQELALSKNDVQKHEIDTNAMDSVALFEYCLLYMEDDSDMFDDSDYYIENIPKIISRGQKEILLSYSTDWGSNNRFVVYLSKLFPKLIFELEYAGAHIEGAGRYVIKNGDEVYNELCYDQIYFGRDKQYLKYEFSFNCNRSAKYILFGLVA